MPVELEGEPAFSAAICASRSAIVCCNCWIYCCICAINAELSGEEDTSDELGCDEMEDIDDTSGELLSFRELCDDGIPRFTFTGNGDGMLTLKGGSAGGNVALTLS